MNSEPSWDLYRTFHAVLREGSLSGAARRLDMSQPSIARHIDALETALGAKLFLRTPRGLSPTDAALELKPLAERLAATSAALRRTAEGGGGGGALSGTVRISASEVVAVEHLPPILARMRQAHPGETIELRPLSPATESIIVTSPSGKAETLRRRGEQPFVYRLTDELGVYRVTEGGRETRRFAVNLFDPAESDVRVRIDETPEEAEQARAWLCLERAPQALSREKLGDSDERALRKA